MANNTTPRSGDEKAFRSLLDQFAAAKIEPSPYLKTRVLAHLNEGRKFRGTLLFWKFLSVGSLASLVIVGWISLSLHRQMGADAIIQHSYVIHIDFNQNDKDLVAHAEVVLPSDVHFVSASKVIRQEKKLRLPVEVKALGRRKLPFVVASDSSGEKEVRVRLLNDNDELIREQILKFKFAKDGSSVTF